MRGPSQDIAEVIGEEIVLRNACSEALVVVERELLQELAQDFVQVHCYDGAGVGGHGAFSQPHEGGEFAEMTGSLLAMPLLIMNMGGEMIYILEQRLRAQEIAKDKAERGASPAAA